MSGQHVEPTAKKREKVPGSGRKQMGLTLTNIGLTNAEWEFAKTLGDGKKTDGIRKALEIARTILDKKITHLNE